MAKIKQYTPIDDVLDVQGQGFQKLPIYICTFIDLKSLILHNNGIESLPNQMSKLQHLQYLDLSCNCFKTVPVCVAKLKSLTRLDISGNQLTDLPSAFSELLILERIDLSNNRFDELPNPLLPLKELTEIDLSWNDLSTVPDKIRFLAKLKSLNLSHNQIKEVNGIRRLNHLEELDLSYNQILDADLEDIRPLKVLQKLNVSHNGVQCLPTRLTIEMRVLHEESDSDKNHESWNVSVFPGQTGKYTLPSNFYLEIPPLAVNRQVSLNAVIIQDGELLPELQQFDRQESDIIGFEPNTFTFSESVTIGCTFSAVDHTRYNVIMQSVGGKRWKELKTKVVETSMFAEIRRPSGIFVVISRPHIEKLEIKRSGSKHTLVQGNKVISVVDIPPNAITEVEASIYAYVQNIDPDISYGDDTVDNTVTFSPVVNIRNEEAEQFQEPFRMTLPLPPPLASLEGVENQTNGGDVDDGVRIMLYDKDGTWDDITDAASPEINSDGGMVSFKTNAFGGYVVVRTIPAMVGQLGSTLKEVCSAMKDGKVCVKLVLLQHEKDPYTILFDTVRKSHVEEKIDTWHKKGYSSTCADGVPFSGDVKLKNGSVVRVDVSEPYSFMASKTERAFYVNGNNHWITYIERKQTTEKQLLEQEIGVVKLSSEISDERTLLGELRFRIPKNAVPLEMKKSSENDTFFQFLAERVAVNNWKSLARRLGLEEHQIERLEFIGGTTDHIKGMFLLWEANVCKEEWITHAILQALRDEGMGILAEEIEEVKDFHFTHL
ncbi:uncharacterized protein LOC144451437 [Glandiceps talaboti]